VDRGNPGIVLALGILAGIQATWVWGDSASYSSFSNAGDSGPSIDPTGLFTPELGPLLTALGSASIIEASAAERGLEPAVPWTHWLGWVPASVAIGTELRLFLRDGPASEVERKVIAIGTAASTLWFLGSMAVHAGQPTEDPPAASASRRAPVHVAAVVPILPGGDGPRTIGAAITGRF
jgi:hypothetical protein